MKEFYDQTFKENDSINIEDLASAEFDNCSFHNITFQNISFRSSLFSECHFENCHFQSVDLLNTRMKSVSFKESKLTGINWSDCNSLEEINFNNCKLDYSVFQNLDLRDLSASNSSFREVDFSGSKLIKSRFIDCDLLASVFSGSNLEDADFSGSGPLLLDPKFTKLKNTKIDLSEASEILKTIGLLVN